MSESAIVPIIKNSVSGVVIGTVTAMGVDMVFGQVMNMMPSNGHSSKASAYGSMAFQLVAAPALAGMGVYLGDQLLGMVVDRASDPLFGLFYLNTVYTQSHTIAASAKVVRTLLGSLMSPASKPPPKGGSGGGSGKAAAPPAMVNNFTNNMSYETNLAGGGVGCCK